MSDKKNAKAMLDINSDKNKKKEALDLSLMASEQLKNFAKNFYNRLVTHNTLRVDSNGQVLPEVFTTSRDDRCYDAMARLFEGNSKSCCAVCFDGEKILIAHNDVDLFEMGTSIFSQLKPQPAADTSTSKGTVSYQVDLNANDELKNAIENNTTAEAQSALPDNTLSQQLTELLQPIFDIKIFAMHIMHIAKMAKNLKTKGREPISGYYYGGEGFSVALNRHMFLSRRLRHIHEDEGANLFVYNLLLLYGEYEKKSKAPPNEIVDEFWQGFNNTYDLEKSLKERAIPLTIEQVEIYIRYLKDVVKVENFIVRLPLGHPILESYAAGNDPIELVTDGSEGMHAEMRLYLHLVRLGKKAKYIGISKLCCAHCNLAITTAGIEQVYESLENDIVIGRRGFHGNGYVWPLSMELLSDENFMKKFLGEDNTQLSQEYKKFSEEIAVTHSRRGKLGSQKELAEDIIQNICLLKMGDLKRHQFNEPFLGGAKNLYAPGSISLADERLYEEMYYFEEGDRLFTREDIVQAKIDLDQTPGLARVRILKLATKSENDQFTEDRERNLQEPQNKTPSQSMQDYIRHTFDLYAANMFGVTKGHFVIHTDLFVPKDRIALKINWGVLFLSQKNYKNAKRLFKEVLAYYAEDKTQCSQSTIAVAYYGLGVANLRLQSPNEALGHLQEAVRLMPNETKYIKKLEECQKTLKINSSEVAPTFFASSVKTDRSTELDQQPVTTYTSRLTKAGKNAN